MAEPANQQPYEGLSPDRVIDAVESVGLLSDARILALNSYENRVYQVGIEDGEPLIAKFYRPARWTDAQILEEHRFSQELVGLEIPIVAPLQYEGQTLLEYDGFRFSLFPRRGGRSPDLDNPDHLLVMGRFLGRLHQAGKTRAFEHRRALGIEDFAERSAEFLLENDFIPGDLVPAYNSLAEDLINRMQSIFREYSGVEWIRVHGDCHMGNVLWRDETPHFVDLDDCMMAPAMQDLWMLLSGERHEQLALLDELISGYDEFCSFQPRELALMETLRTLRLMHYSAWLARRWHDPAFPMSFPWFNTAKYWSSHILELREQLAALDEPPLTLM